MEWILLLMFTGRLRTLSTVIVVMVIRISMEASLMNYNWGSTQIVKHVLLKLELYWAVEGHQHSDADDD